MCEDEHDGWEEWFSRKREAADRAQDLAEDDHPVSVYVIEVTGSAKKRIVSDEIEWRAGIETAIFY